MSNTNATRLGLLARDLVFVPSTTGFTGDPAVKIVGENLFLFFSNAAALETARTAAGYRIEDGQLAIVEAGTNDEIYIYQRGAAQANDAWRPLIGSTTSVPYDIHFTVEGDGTDLSLNVSGSDDSGYRISNTLTVTAMTAGNVSFPAAAFNRFELDNATFPRGFTTSCKLVINGSLLILGRDFTVSSSTGGTNDIVTFTTGGFTFDTMGGDVVHIYE